jgi:hypothetical protein
MTLRTNHANAQNRRGISAAASVLILMIMLTLRRECGGTAWAALCAVGSAQCGLVLCPVWCLPRCARDEPTPRRGGNVGESQSVLVMVPVTSDHIDDRWNRGGLSATAWVLIMCPLYDALMMRRARH